MIDLADLIYAQHERIAVHLNFDHINTNLKKYNNENSNSLKNINQKMTELFYQLARTVIESQVLRQDFKIIQLESLRFFLDKSSKKGYSVISKHIEELFK